MLIAAAAVVASSTTAKEGEQNEDHSEWRLFLTQGVGGYSFQNVVVNEGFQNRDFQTKQGTFSPVIDPELLGTLRKEAADIWNRESYGIWHLSAVFLGPCLCLSLLFFGRYFLGQGPVVDVITDSLIVFGASHVYMMIAGFCGSCCLSSKTDDRAAALLVESYHATFLQEYGIELGYGNFKVDPQDKESPIYPCIYLRRSRQFVDQEEASVIGHSHSCNDMDPFFPPIYVTRLIPGEIVIEEKEYNAAALMKVDADTWSLLQSTHQTMTPWHPIRKYFAIVVLLALYPVFVCLLITPYFGFVNMWAFILIATRVYQNAEDKRNLRVYEEVTKVVNSALQKDKTKAHLAVEFHDSESPGREGKLGRRYQFVARAEQPIPVWKVCKVFDGNLV